MLKGNEYVRVWINKGGKPLPDPSPHRRGGELTLQGLGLRAQGSGSLVPKP